MPIATPEVYAEMLDRAKAGSLRLPGHQRLVVADPQRRDPRASPRPGSDGIIQVSTGGAEYFSGPTVKNMVTGSLALAAYAHEVAKNYPVNIALHTDHCPKDKLDGFVRPLHRGVRRAGQGRRRRRCFQSHMWDGSAVPLDENLEIAQELLALRQGRATSSSRSRSASSAARRTASPTRSTRSSTRPPRTPWPPSRRSASARTAATWPP